MAESISLLLLAALGWLSVATLRLERAESAARAQAQQEERIRLALWRIPRTPTQPGR